MANLLDFLSFPCSSGAAKETMESGLLPKILAYAGAITVERTWRAVGRNTCFYKKMLK